MVSIECQDVSHHFSQKLLFEHIDLDISIGVFGIAGANGSGKSTLLKIIGGLLKPKHGRVIWKKNALLIESEHQRFIMGYAAPYFSFYDELSVFENLMFLANVRNIQPNLVTEWVDFFGLTPQMNQNFKSLSSGQQQRLRLISGVFFDPDAILLDEPGSTLDEAGINSIKHYLDRSRTKKTIILASNMTSELDWCDSVFNLKTKKL